MVVMIMNFISFLKLFCDLKLSYCFTREVCQVFTKILPIMDSLKSYLFKASAFHGSWIIYATFMLIYFSSTFCLRFVFSKIYMLVSYFWL